MNNYPNSILEVLNEEQKKVFTTLLNKKSILNLDLVKELNKLISSFNGWFSEDKTYKQILEHICLKRNLKYQSNFTTYKLEELILENKFKTIVENLSEEEKIKFQAEIKKFAEKNGVDSNQAKSITALGTLAGANFAGFGLYVMASTVVGGITSAIGLTLPFAVYTGMSSALSIITGPVGWIAGLGYLFYTFRNDTLETAQQKLTETAKGVKNVFTGNLEFGEIIVCQICSFRILLNQQFDEKNTENDNKLKNLKEKLSLSLNIQKDLKEKISNFNKHLSEVNFEVLELESKTNFLTKEILEIQNKKRKIG